MYPFEVEKGNQQMEQTIRDAAKKVDEILSKYMERYRDEPKLDARDYFAIVAFHFSLAYSKLLETRDIEALEEIVREMDNELDVYLKQK